MSKFILSGFGDEIAPDLDTQLSVMAQNGIHSLELRSADGKNVSKLTASEAKSIKARLVTVNFTVSSIGSPIGKIGLRDDFSAHLDTFRRTLETARILKAPYMRIFSFYIPECEKPEDLRDDVFERMERLCEEAAGSGVRLLHENELGIYGDTPERCLDILQTFGDGRIGGIFDPANFINLTQRVEIYPYAWHLLKKHVEYLHIKDAVHVDDPLHNHHEVRPAGYGDGRIADILRELDEDGYEGYLSIEPHLGTFAGFDQLEKRLIPQDMPKGGPQTFSIAAKALMALLCDLQK